MDRTGTTGPIARGNRLIYWGNGGDIITSYRGFINCLNKRRERKAIRKGEEVGIPLVSISAALHHDFTNSRIFIQGMREVLGHYHR